MKLFTAKAFVWPPARSASVEVHLQLVGVGGDGHAMAIWAGADVTDMECVQFHPTGMVWPLSVRGILVTEGVRGDGGVLRNSEGKRFMFDYVADMFRAETAETKEEADAWYEDHINNRRTPDLLPRDEVARAINSQVKAGGARRTAACTSTSPSRRSQVHPAAPALDVPPVHGAGRRRHHGRGDGGRPDLPLHDGRGAGRRRDPGRHRARASSPSARSRAACTGRTASAATRCRTSSCSGDGPASGRRTSRRAAPDRRSVDAAEIASVIDDAFAPFGREDGYNPYDVQHELQETMQSLVGIIRTGPELEEALAKLEDLKQQTAKVQVKGGRAYNPGWNLATDLPSMITTSIAVAQGALNRKESWGGHTREDYPGPDPEMGKVNFVQHQTGERGYLAPIAIAPEPLPEMPAELRGSSRKDTEPWLTRLRRRRRRTGTTARAAPGKRRRRDRRGRCTERREGHHAGVARATPSGGEFTDYVMPAVEGEVVLDVIHRIQADPAPDLACRWNCKAGKCGSCSAEINGLPRLMCMTRMDTLPEGEPITVAPMKAFPIIRDLVTDVSFNYEMAKTIPAFEPGPEPEGGYRMQQIDVDRGQEFRKCIECFMCQDVCHVIRDHEENKPKYAGPRFFIRFAELEMHPLDSTTGASWPTTGPRHVQHHQVLHRGVPRAHQDHRQRHHPDEGARGRRPLRPGGLARAQDHRARRSPPKRHPPSWPCWLGSGAALPGPLLARFIPIRVIVARHGPLSLARVGAVVRRRARARSTSPTRWPRPRRGRWPRPTGASAWPSS